MNTYNRSKYIFLVSANCVNPIHTRGCVPPPGQSIAQNSKTEQAITLKLGDVYQIAISNIFDFTN